jgi:hypothetical protein
MVGNLFHRLKSLSFRPFLPGVHLTTFFMTGYYLLLERKKSNIKWLVFIFLLFTCGTTNLCFNANFIEKALIDERNYPGGPLAYQIEQETSSVLTAGDALSAFSALLAQILLVCNHTKNMSVQ